MQLPNECILSTAIVFLISGVGGGGKAISYLGKSQLIFLKNKTPFIKVIF